MVAAKVNKKDKQVQTLHIKTQNTIPILLFNITILFTTTTTTFLHSLICWLAYRLDVFSELSEKPENNSLMKGL